MTVDISNELNTIKSTQLGRTMRPALHDSIEKQNKELNRTSTLIDEFIKNAQQVTPQNAEIVAARIDNNSNMPIAYATLGERLDRMKEDSENKVATLNKNLEQTNAQLSDVKSKIELTPDDFRGTDIEKLQACFDYIVANKNLDLSIRLNRNYDVTGGSIFIDGNWWEYINVNGGGIIKNDSGYVFDSHDDHMNHNAPIFNNCYFKSNTTAVLINGDKFIRPKSNQCRFEGMALIHSTEYLQSVYVVKSEIGNINSSFIKAPTSFDTNFTDNRCESSKSRLIELVNDTSQAIAYFGLRINNNLIEGYTTQAPIYLSGGYGLSIDKNYFEANVTDVKLVKTNAVSVFKGSITDNIHGGVKGKYNIECDNGVNINGLMIESNHTTLNGADRAYINKRISSANNGSNTSTSGGNVVPPSVIKCNRNTTIPVEIITRNDGSPKFSFKLPLRNSLYLHNQPQKSYLITLKGRYGSSVYQTGYLVLLVSHCGILKSDGIWKEKLFYKILDGRNTNGKNNGDATIESDFIINFKQSGEWEIDPSVEEANIDVYMLKWKSNEFCEGSMKALSHLEQYYMN